VGQVGGEVWGSVCVGHCVGQELTVLFNRSQRGRCTNEHTGCGGGVGQVWGVWCVGVAQEPTALTLIAPQMLILTSTRVGSVGSVGQVGECGGWEVWCVQE
jgi:hypothetical protein